MTNETNQAKVASRRQMLINTAAMTVAGAATAMAATVNAQLPSVPSLPSMPSKPSLPSVPNMPGMPSAPRAASSNSGSTITMKDGTQIYYKDWGTGPAVVFSHGWPLSSDAWEDQMMFLASNGFRCIAHDRRGHGRSSQPWNGNDMDTYADDLATVVNTLDLKGATFVGHSTGGGEAVRYIGRHGQSRVAKAVLVGAVTPLMLKTANNPDGLPMSVFDGIRSAVQTDRAQFFKDLTTPFFGFNRPGVKDSQGKRDTFVMLGMQCGLRAAYECIKQFSETEFTEDLKKMTVPTLVLHGDDDQIVPIGASAQAATKLLKNARLEVYKGGSHALPLMNKDKMNADLLAFLKQA